MALVDHYTYKAHLSKVQERSCEDPDEEKKLKHLLDVREKEYRRQAQQHQTELNRKDAEIQRQEQINESLRKRLSELHVSSTPKSCICRFCGKETARRKSLQAHLRGMSTDMVCVDLKISHLLQAPLHLSDEDTDLLEGICHKIATASATKIRQWQAKIPQLAAFQAKYEDEIGSWSGIWYPRALASFVLVHKCNRR